MPHSLKDVAAPAKPQHKGSWTSFLRSIASFSGDLSSLAAPPFILSTTSLVEYSSYWADRPSLFVAPVNEPDPAKRALLVLRWFLSTLRQRTAYRDGKVGGEKKPLNPFLGELFVGKWEDAAGTTQIVSEQVSHHPPVTAYCIRNKQHGVRLHGYTAPKTSFSNTVHIRQSGHALLHLDRYNEDYLITLPPIHIEGLLYGSPSIELSKSSYIQASSGFTAKVDYSGRGWLGGKKTSFTATVFLEGRPKDVLYSIEGQWANTFTITDAKTQRKLETFDGSKHAITPLKIAPLEKQDPLESRRAWHGVTSAIVNANMDLVSIEKAKIEQRQREMRKRERVEGREWKTRYFEKMAGDALVDTLGSKIQYKSEVDKTGGMWRLNSRGYAFFR